MNRMDYAEIFRLLPQSVQAVVARLSFDEMETLCRVIVEHHGGPLSTMSDEAWASLNAANASRPSPRAPFVPQPPRTTAGATRPPYKPNLLKGETK